jgi:hypothetical protein
MSVATLFIPPFVMLGGGYLAYKAVTYAGPGARWVQRYEEQVHRENVKALNERLEEVIVGLSRWLSHDGGQTP